MINEIGLQYHFVRDGDRTLKLVLVQVNAVPTELSGALVLLYLTAALLTGIPSTTVNPFEISIACNIKTDITTRI